MKGYKTSRDYKRLKDLLDMGYEVVCFTTYDFHHNVREPHEPLMTTDICRARLLKYNNPENDVYMISVRGLVYIEYFPNWKSEHQESFEEQCESEKIEFIEPTVE